MTVNEFVRRIQTKASMPSTGDIPIKFNGKDIECVIELIENGKGYYINVEQPTKKLALNWHKATETPKPDTEVLAEVKGFKHNRFIVLMWTKEGWWQHIPRMNDIMPSDGWIGVHGLFVIRWTYIDEKDLALTWEDVAMIITIYEAGIDNGDYRRYNEAEWIKEYSQDILRRFNEMKEKKK